MFIPHCNRWNITIGALNCKENQPFEVYDCEYCGKMFADFESVFRKFIRIITIKKKTG